MSGKLAGRVAAVTGGGSGIGRAIATLFAQEGARVAIVDRDAAAAAAVQAELAALGPSAFVAVADVGDETAVICALDAVTAALGNVEILVNNAGIDTVGPLVDVSLGAWETMFRVHMTGTFLCTRYVLPAMQRARWGRIINLSSQLAHKGAPGMVSYCAAKAAVMGFTRALAWEVAKDNITVNCLNPGPIDTPLVAALPREWIDMKLAELPIGRLGRTSEVAPAALLLASDDGGYFLGASLNMNGGDYMI
jgi:3-oxoacyl-[acyl-carrier protein] reductase